MIKSAVADFESFKFKGRITGRTSAATDTKDVGIAVALKCLGNIR